MAKCELSKCTFAHVVPQKGIDPDLYAVKRLTRDILRLGQNNIILKSDNERSIVALLRNIIKALRIEDIENTQEAHPAAYDSSSNASTESEVTFKQVAGIGTLKACLESCIRMRVPNSERRHLSVQKAEREKLSYQNVRLWRGPVYSSSV